MSKTFDNEGVRKSTGRRVGRPAKQVHLTAKPYRSSLDEALEAQRTPSIHELIDELKCRAGVNLISLRSDKNDNVYKSSHASGQITRTVVDIANLEHLLATSEEAMSQMTQEELIAYNLSLIEIANKIK